MPSNRQSTNGANYDGLANQSEWFPWADNQTLITLSPKTTQNRQLPLAGIQAFASCGLNTYNFTNYVPSQSKGPKPELNFEFEDVNPDSNGGSPYKLHCKNNCSDLGNSSAMACSAQSSVVNITPFDYDAGSLYDAEDKNWTTKYTFGNVSSTFQGQTLSCVQQDLDDYQSTAWIQLAIQGPQALTQVANCILSVAYLRPTVNTLIGSYIESTGAMSAQSVLDASPVELLNLTMASFVSLFHNGPPTLTPPPGNNCSIPPISNGFK